MLVSGRTALVTGANRGLGRHLAEQLRDRGAKVCAGARRPELARGVQAAKSDPAEVARILLDGLEAGTPEILAEGTSKQVQSLLSGGVPALRAAGQA